MAIKIYRQQQDDKTVDLYHLKIVDVDATDQVRALDITAQTSDPAQWIIDNQATLATQLAVRPVHETLTTIYQERQAKDDLRVLPTWLRTPAQVDAFIDANVTSIATARTVLKQLARMNIMLARMVWRLGDG